MISLQLIGIHQTGPYLGISPNDTTPNFSSVPSPFYPFTGIPVQGKRNVISHCVFFSCPYAKSLTDFVFRTHMQDLKDVTQEVHYENYRAERLSRQGQGPPSPRKTIEAMYVNRFP